MTRLVCSILLLLLCGAASAAEPLRLTITTNPPADQIIPNEVPATIVVTATRADGSPVTNARISVSLDMPPKNAFFSTGFPIAEGTPLIRATTLAPQGKLELTTLFPIRGVYPLNASAELPDEPQSKSSTALSLGVNEEPAVVRNFCILIALLVGFGLLSGIVLGRSDRRQIGRAAAAVMLFLALRSSQANAHEEHGPATPPEPTSNHATAESPSGDRIEVNLDREFATVGHMATLKGAFTTKAKPGATLFTLSFVNLDHDKEIFRTELLSPDGNFELQHQFVDGADHRVTVSARPVNAKDAAPLEAQMNIAVHAIHPPATIVYRTLAFLLAITGAAMAAGYFTTLRLARGRMA